MSLALRAPPVFGTGLPLIAALAETVRSLVQAPTSVLELFPPILLAVPKSKVSHSRKSMRSANKGLKEKFNVVTCQSCGRAKRSHHLCPYCYSDISRGFKTAARVASRYLTSTPSTSSSLPSASSIASKIASTLSSRPAEGESKLREPRWTAHRGGALPMKQGDLLTKWMRRRAGLGKEDQTLRYGEDINFETREDRLRQKQAEKQAGEQ